MNHPVQKPSQHDLALETLGLRLQQGQAPERPPAPLTGPPERGCGADTERVGEVMPDTSQDASRFEVSTYPAF